MSTQHRKKWKPWPDRKAPRQRKKRRRGMLLLIAYRTVVFGSILGGTAATLSTVDLRNNTAPDWRWVAGGLILGVAVLLVVPEPRSPKRALRYTCDECGHQAQPRRPRPRPRPEPEPLTVPIVGPLVDTGCVADLATMLRHVSVTDLDDTQFAGLPVPVHFESTQWWLDDLTDYLRVQDMTTDQLTALLSAMRPAVVIADG
jgi:hypothetical protein